MSGHHVSRRVYFAVGFALLVLFLLTVGVAYIDLGPFNVVVAMAIATFKAILVVLYFMHVRYSSRVTWVFVSASFFWLVILLVLTLSDYATRGV
ncbi:MAG: cytochrome C oxidase subunit IV family protein [Ignavibacterium sp.]|jgi:cytochrome c oxidase subunit 4